MLDPKAKPGSIATATTRYGLKRSAMRATASRLSLHLQPELDQAPDFADLEPMLCDFESMGKIAAQIMVSADDSSNRELVFAVLHLSEILTAFKANYYAAWHGEKQLVRHEAPAPISPEAQPARLVHGSSSRENRAGNLRENG